MLKITKVCSAIALAVFVSTAPALAQGNAAMPTPDEISQGWIALFDGESLFGWNNIGGADWKVVDGVLTCEGGRGAGWLATTSIFGDFELVVKLRVSPESSSGVVVRSALEGHPSETGSGVVTIAVPKGGASEWQEVKVTAAGSDVKATVDGKDVGALACSRAQGFIGIQYHNKGKVEVASAKLRPTTSTPLFNGKDLEGWEIIPGHKSEFSVMDGTLHIVNGNGQIETTGLYKDFLLQLAIKSNGEHLNSGVFYRGPKGIFWKGYESQVRNHWEGDDRTKPVDFGTGGNYGNQSARRVVSSDKEWFYKTIVCHGPHAVVWINGYLVSDFSDSRPVSSDSNGKAGYVPGPGTIHLQGHDPTTDLQFKNINIQEYK